MMGCSSTFLLGLVHKLDNRTLKSKTETQIIRNWISLLSMMYKCHLFMPKPEIVNSNFTLGANCLKVIPIQCNK